MQKHIFSIFIAIMLLLGGCQKAGIGVRATAYPQTDFNSFVENFISVGLPIDSIQKLTTKDTLNGIITNDIIIRNQSEKPMIADSTGVLNKIKQYYGLYPEEVDDYLTDKKNEKGEWIRLYFHPKIQPIGQLKLHSEYKTVIIKVVAYDVTFYDLWSFTKQGKALSVVCLFWGLRDGGPKDEKVTYTIVDSKITDTGNIIWHEHDSGLHTYRTYNLKASGYFQIVEEKQEGVFEF